MWCFTHFVFTLILYRLSSPTSRLKCVNGLSVNPLLPNFIQIIFILWTSPQLSSFYDCTLMCNKNKTFKICAHVMVLPFLVAMICITDFLESILRKQITILYIGKFWHTGYVVDFFGGWKKIDKNKVPKFLSI